jgi:hypothetical protein
MACQNVQSDEAGGDRDQHGITGGFGNRKSALRRITQGHFRFLSKYDPGFCYRSGADSAEERVALPCVLNDARLRGGRRRTPFFLRGVEMNVLRNRQPQVMAR